MTHITEEAMIAYLMEGDQLPAGMKEHVLACANCTAMANSVRQTLQAFHPTPVAQADLDEIWLELSDKLPIHVKPWWRRLEPFRWPMPVYATAVVLCAVGGILLALHVQRVPSAPVAQQGQLTLSTGPTLEAYIASAERLFTSIHHLNGSFDRLNEEEQEQARALHRSNAQYVQQASKDGRVATATVLSSMDQSLTLLTHERTSEISEIDRSQAEDVLLNLRVLQQNEYIHGAAHD